MKLTTNDPKDNVQTALNLFYVKDKQAWVRGGGPGPEYKDIPLYDYIRQAIKLVATCPPMFSEQDDMKLAECMVDWAMDGNCSLEGLIGTLYTAGWAFAELRARLMDYEDTGLEPKEIARLKAATTWISVKERLPAHDEKVIVLRKGGIVEQGYKDVNDWWRVYGTRVKSVTHWMPMAKPPKEDVQ